MIQRLALALQRGINFIDISGKLAQLALNAGLDKADMARNLALPKPGLMKGKSYMTLSCICIKNLTR